MRSAEKLETTRLILDWEIGREGELPQLKNLRTPTDPWASTLIRETLELRSSILDIITSVIEVYKEQIRRDEQTSARAIDPRKPVRLSYGVLETVKIIEQKESILEHHEEEILRLAENISFEDQNEYVETAKACLNFVDKMPERTGLYLHTYLWIQWVRESLTQARQFAQLFRNGSHLQDYSDDSFPYIAHPPIIVATIAGTTMLEEVGAKYINSFVDNKSYNSENTSVGSIFEDIQRNYSKADQFDTDLIEDLVIDSRDDVAHYITRRKEVVSIEQFEIYIDAVRQIGKLVVLLLEELVEKPLTEFDERIEPVLSHS